MDLNEYQKQANLTDQRPEKDERGLVFPLMGLASEVGSLINQYKKRVRDGDAHALFSDRAAEDLGDVLWYVTNIATKIGFTLQDIADLNLRRTGERWPVGTHEEPARLLDEGWSRNEQLPREAIVEFTERREGDRLRVYVESNGKQLGDPLSDMAWEDDAYRYHDAFHLTFAAMLGWSPITRAHFDKQRNSEPRYREIEDSGRAKVVEEAIAVLLFEHAREQRFFEGVEHLDYSLLQTILNMVSRLEVRVRSAREWELAILRSYEIWRYLRDNHGGKLHLDLRKREISYASSPN